MLQSGSCYTIHSGDIQTPQIVQRGTYRTERAIERNGNITEFAIVCSGVPFPLLTPDAPWPTDSFPPFESQLLDPPAGVHKRPPGAFRAVSGLRALHGQSGPVRLAHVLLRLGPAHLLHDGRHWRCPGSSLHPPQRQSHQATPSLHSRQVGIPKNVLVAHHG